VTQVYSLQLVPRPAVPRSREREALPGGSLVLTDDPRIADWLSGSAGRRVTTVLVPPEAATWDEHAISRLVHPGDGMPGHVRVVASLRSARWPAAPRPELLALQEAAFVSVKRLARVSPPDSSLAVLILDSFAGGLPHPHGALLTGLTKAVAWELPQTPAHAVVTDETTLPAALEQLRRESGCARGLTVAYYRGRLKPAARLEERLLQVDTATAATEDGAHPPSTGAGPVVVAVGGARGITARCLEGMRTPSMLWLLGSTSPADMAAQSAQIGTATSAEYVRKRRAEDPGAHVGRLRRWYDRCGKSRESLSNLAVLRQRIGADRVRYLGCDITDERAVRGAAETIRGATPQIDLLIHGAGISGARRLAAKDLATFRLVRDTKVAGYHNLKAAFSDPAPVLWCNFSSVAGAFGLPGESDYGPANDMLNAAARFETACPGKAECSVNWSLWGESGLGPRAGFTEYTARAGQLGLLGDAEGQRLFNAEVEVHRGCRAVPVPLGDAESRMVRTRFPELPDAPEGRPYLGSPSRVREGEAVWELDFARYAHLYGHVRQSRALVPGMLILELSAEAVGHLTGVTSVRVFRNIRFRAPIAVDPRLARYQLTATFTPAGFGGGVVRASVTSRLPLGSHARIVPHFDVLIPLGAVGTPTSADDQQAESSRRAPATMFMSGLFDQVRDARVGADATSARWEPRLPPAGDREFFSLHRIPWLLADALLQTACTTAIPNRYATPRSIRELKLHTTGNDLILWERARNGIRLDTEHHDMTADGTAAETGSGSSLLTMTGLALSGRVVSK
jgi:NAD(P)-dependent dehydrogenase (short-subunit alcohol dehydrogenase family)